MNAEYSSLSWLGHRKRIQYDQMNNLPFMFTAPSSTNMKYFLSSANPLFKTQCEDICCSNNKDTFNTLLNNNVCGSCDCETTIKTNKINHNKTNINKTVPKTSTKIPNVLNIDE